LYVGNLSHGITSSDLQDLFERLGTAQPAPGDTTLDEHGAALEGQAATVPVGSEAMIPKKVDDTELARPRLSLASRLLGGAVRTALPVPTPQEPWRRKKPKGKHRGKSRQ
jgi:RNA recognition motif-containing protein